MLRLQEVDKGNLDLRRMMGEHYSRPGGFVGRSVLYLVWFGAQLHGAIGGGGSATQHLPGRNGFLGVSGPDNGVVNNMFFHLERDQGRYPCRNFASAVLEEWRGRITVRWRQKYGDSVKGFETLVELPRTGDCYLRDGWTHVGTTKGFTCRRVAGPKTEKFTGMRVWNYDDPRPKLVFCRLT